MENVVLGLLAHVDRGKTSLSESLLLESGEIKQKGRVDHGDSLLDHDELERKKGITIYAKSVYFSRENKRFFLLDTPGHREFSGEMERALRVLDYGILLLDMKEGIGKREIELWNLTREAGLPLFLFVNKMDLFQGEKGGVIEELQSHFPENIFLDCSLLHKKMFFPEKKLLSVEEKELMENIAGCSMESMEEYLESGGLSLKTVKELIKKRSFFPVFFGSALKEEGTREFLEALTLLSKNRIGEEAGGGREKTEEERGEKEKEKVSEGRKSEKEPGETEEKSGYIYKITRDEKGRRIAKARLFSGRLLLREEWFPGEKLTELRMEEGDSYTEISEVEEGSLFLTPVSDKITVGAFPIKGERRETREDPLQVELSLLEGDILRYASELKGLSREFPEWDIRITEEGKVRIRSLGALQKELMQDIFRRRTGEELRFSPIELIYGEGPSEEAYGKAKVESPGHYFAVLLRLLPFSGEEEEEEQSEEKKESTESGQKYFLLTADEGVEVKKEWVSRLQTEWEEMELNGPAFSGPYTHYRIELLEAEYREKSSYYIDFKTAVLEAFSMARKNAGLHLFSPVFSYNMKIGQAELGPVLQTIERLGGKQEELLQEETGVFLRGKIPGESLNGFLEEAQRLGGEAEIRFFSFEKMAEEEEREILPGEFRVSSEENVALKGTEDKKETNPKKKKEKTGAYIQDIELEEIFLRTFGPVRNRGKEALLSEQKLILSREKEEKQKAAREQYEKKGTVSKKKLLLVDGYNFMFAKEALKELAKENLMAGREKVIQYLSEYAVFYDTEVYLIFDAYHVKGNPGTKQHFGKNLELVFTKEGESADFTLSKMAKDFAEKGRTVSIVTSDRAVQVQAFSGKGVSRYSSREFYGILEEMRKRISEMEL